MKKIYLLINVFIPLCAYAQENNNEIDKIPIKQINTRYIEAEPKISANGQILYFTRRNDARNKGGKNDMGDIWFSKLQADSTWSEAENLGKPINNAAFNQVIGIHAGGKMMLISGEYQTDKHSDIYITAQSYLGWTSPQIIPFEKLDFKNDDATFSATPDLNVLIFSMKNYKNGFGHNDLYVSFRTKENKWTEPRNLGNIINTEEDELYPVIAHDYKTLYFSSRGFDGFGDFDIYMSTRLDSSWQNWSKPVNLGQEINTSGYDADFTFDAKSQCAYISSDIESVEDFDIYRLKLPEENKPSPVSIINIKFSNLLKDSSLTYDLSCYTSQSGYLVLSEDNLKGEHDFILPNGQNYVIQVNADDFLQFTDTIFLQNQTKHVQIDLQSLLLPPRMHFALDSITNEEILLPNIDIIDLDERTFENLQFGVNKNAQNFIRLFKLSTVEKNKPLNVVLQDINFEFASTGLNPQEQNMLKILAKELLKYPDLKIEIIGHTDDIGGEAENLALSLERAKEVADFLISNGIPKTSISYTGKGQSLPIVPNTSEENRKINRRVEFKVSKN